MLSLESEIEISRRWVFRVNQETVPRSGSEFCLRALLTYFPVVLWVI